MRLISDEELMKLIMQAHYHGQASILLEYTSRQYPSLSTKEIVDSLPGKKMIAEAERFYYTVKQQNL